MWVENGFMPHFTLRHTRSRSHGATESLAQRAEDSTEHRSMPTPGAEGPQRGLGQEQDTHAGPAEKAAAEAAIQARTATRMAAIAVKCREPDPTCIFIVSHEHFSHGLPPVPEWSPPHTHTNWDF